MKIHGSIAIFVAILFAFTHATLQAQRTDESSDRSKILALEHVWNQAELLQDLKALDALFDNALVYIDTDGVLLTKAQFLSTVKTARLQQLTTESINVQIFDNTAIATGIFRASEFRNGKLVVLRGRFTDTWIRNHSNWLCIAVQSTPISDQSTTAH